MTATPYVPAKPLDEQAIVVLREILADPSLPVANVAAGPDGLRTNRLREALDHLVSVQAAAVAIDSAAAGEQLLGALRSLDPELAEVLTGHVVATRLLVDLDPGRARNAALGDIGRGDLVTIAAAVLDWTWDGGSAPTAEQPLRTVHARIELDDVPNFYDEILVWLADAGQLVVLPTYRQELSWAPAGDGGRRWVITLDGASIHVDDLIPLATDPRGVPFSPTGAS